MTDEKQDAAIKQRATEIVIAHLGPMFTSTEHRMVERAMREGMAIRVPDAQHYVGDMGPREHAYVNGWNACRAAMLARNGE